MVETARHELQVETCTRRYYKHFNDRRFDDAERMVDPEALFSYPGASECLIGRAAYAELAHRWATAFPDGRRVVLAVHVHGDVAVTELLTEGTHENALDLPGLPPIPASRRRKELRMRETIVVHNGLIASVKTDFDPADLAS